MWPSRWDGGDYGVRGGEGRATLEICDRGGCLQSVTPGAVPRILNVLLRIDLLKTCLATRR
jgi:hypothetical protein